MYKLHIANKNYSSWSMRPWLVMTELGISFEEVLHAWGDDSDWADYRKLSPTGLVPCLQNDDILIWDSLAIIEYLAENHPGVWAEDTKARAWSRSASAEMHSGFSTLRTMCSMSCGVTVRLFETPHELLQDIQRIDSLWQQGLKQFGGPFLAGDSFTAVDAFYAPVVSRFKTYGIDVNAESTAYTQRIMDTKAMSHWYTDACNEIWREPHHEVDISRYGEITSDQRSS